MSYGAGKGRIAVILADYFPVVWAIDPDVTSAARAVELSGPADRVFTVAGTPRFLESLPYPVKADMIVLDLQGDHDTVWQALEQAYRHIADDGALLVQGGALVAEAVTELIENSEFRLVQRTGTVSVLTKSSRLWTNRAGCE
jgi:hypothetical protein